METTKQLDLFGLGPLDPEDPELSHEDRFWLFHAENPEVAKRLEYKALRAQDRGARRWGIKALFEIVRYEYFETTGRTYKINNNYAPYYARYLMGINPALKGFFEIRALTSQDGDHGL